MSPTPHLHLFPPLSLRRLAQVQIRSRRNILCNRILPFPNAGILWLKPASYIATPDKVYSHLPPNLRRGSRPISCCSTWYWKKPSNRPMRGLTIHGYAPKSNTNWTTYLKKNPDTRGLAPYILCQTVRAFARFRITTGQSSSAANSTLPRYLKDRTISRGRP